MVQTLRSVETNVVLTIMVISLKIFLGLFQLKAWGTQLFFKTTTIT